MNVKTRNIIMRVIIGIVMISFLATFITSFMS
ncbi:hypothetical protein CLORY_20870 [Clostridium oryzae]|uniref:DUF4044 domain-containing protein n=1 Tax=Clostridium oryzae TaxID=1450648 RepID=A0A1V4IP25_9CLOT|nr:hypothetical protein CLORY_20870 [Clostridium oryzae]